MFYKSKRIRINGFTMLELVFACTVFAMLISGIILAINRTFVFMNNTRVQIKATNLAREGMEMMFNIRDTNWRKYSGERDKYWLYVGTGSDSDQTKSFFQEGIYAIKEGYNVDGNRFVYAEKLDLDSSAIEKFYSLEDDGFFKDDYNFNKARAGAMISFTGTYRYRSGSAESGQAVTGEMADVMGNGVEFYRIARVYGIYKKDANNSNTLANQRSYSEPKEMRFCVKVFYKLGVGDHSTELCSIMTNFME